MAPTGELHEPIGEPSPGRNSVEFEVALADMEKGLSDSTVAANLAYADHLHEHVGEPISPGGKSVELDAAAADEEKGLSDSTVAANLAYAADVGGEDETSPFWTAHYQGDKCRFSSVFPPVKWVPSYVRTILGKANSEDRKAMGNLEYSLKGDMIAGMTVGFMLVPQCLAFALLAGLPLQCGLYSSFGPLVVYALFGSIRQVQPGPTALMSLLTGQALDSMGLVDPAERIAGATMMAMVCGVASCLLSCMSFGFIVDFMSHSVMNAFCAAAGVTIASSQLKNLLGITVERQKYWWKTVYYLCKDSVKLDMHTAIMGCSLLSFLLFLKYWKSAGSKEKRQKHGFWRFFPTDKATPIFKAMKTVADLSSLICVITGWLWGLAYRTSGIDSVKLVGEVESSGFTFMVPGQGLPASAKMDTIVISSLLMTVVGFLETVAVGGKFATQAKYEYYPNQELMALGLSNVASSLMGGYPGTGSFSRTAVNVMFGATSLLACAISSLLVFGSVYLLLPVIALLPLSALAPLIIQGAIGVINMHEFQVAWRSSKAEFFVMVATFIMSLALSVKEGLALGFVLSVLKTMNELANPNLAVLGRLPDSSFRDIRNYPRAKQLDNAVVVRMDARLNFTNARKLKEFTVRAVQVGESRGSKIRFAVIDAKSINHVDLTGCESLENIAEALESYNCVLIIANLKGPVSKCLAQAGIPEHLKKRGAHLVTSMDQAIAVVQGKQTLGEDVDIKELARRVDAASRVSREARAAGSCDVSMLSPTNYGMRGRAMSGP